jgi:hypothetical protein
VSSPRSFYEPFFTPLSGEIFLVARIHPSSHAYRLLINHQLKPNLFILPHRFCIYCHGKRKNREAERPKHRESSPSLTNSCGSVVIEIDPQQEQPKDNSADSQPQEVKQTTIKIAELPEDTECTSV